MPARVLAFGYYGGDSLGVDIIELNDDGNVSFYEGDIKVLSVWLRYRLLATLTSILLR